MVFEGGRTPICNLTKLWGAECDAWFATSQIRLGRTPGGYQPCHFMGQDIVVPPTAFEHLTRLPYAAAADPSLQSLVDNKRYILFYGGLANIHHGLDYEFTDPWSDAWYSFGGRQTTCRLYSSNSTLYRWDALQRVDNYTDEMMTSRFCLAPAGSGWGGRFKMAVAHGCVPVIVQDGVRMEWEEQLPMEQYAIRVPLYMLHKLPEILDVYINTGRYAKMQKALRCAWRLHWWKHTTGGRAFELLMCTLKARLLGKQPVLDTEKCALQCGDERWVDLSVEHGV